MELENKETGLVWNYLTALKDEYRRIEDLKISPDRREAASESIFRAIILFIEDVEKYVC
jgi:hypothetical protein